LAHETLEFFPIFKPIGYATNHIHGNTEQVVFTLFLSELHGNRGTILSPNPVGVSGLDSSNDGPWNCLVLIVGGVMRAIIVFPASAPALGLLPVQVMGRLGMK